MKSVENAPIILVAFGFPLFFVRGSSHFLGQTRALSPETYAAALTRISILLSPVSLWGLQPPEQTTRGGLEKIEKNERGQNMGTYTRLTIHTDGASRGNPGPSASGIHIVDSTTSQTVAEFGFDLGIVTNNVAEYQAVLSAVEWLLVGKELLAEHIQIDFRLDSNLVVSQLLGLWKIKNPKLRELAEDVLFRLRQLPGAYTIEHISREENKYVDRLANAVLDKRAPDSYTFP